MTVSISDRARLILDRLFGNKIDEHFYDIVDANDMHIFPVEHVYLAKRCFENNRAMDFAIQVLAFKAQEELSRLENKNLKSEFVGWEFRPENVEPDSDDCFAGISVWAIRSDSDGGS